MRERERSDAKKISREDIQAALAEYLKRGGKIQRINSGGPKQAEANVIMSDIDDETFWLESAFESTDHLKNRNS